MASVKLSSALKSLISAPHAQGGPVPLPSQAATTRLFEGLSRSAARNGVGPVTWLTLSSAALVTLNSPATLCELYSFATRGLPECAERSQKASEYAAVMREAGLKSISFSGIPRAINSLGALRAHLEPDVAAKLSTEPTRQLTPSTVPSVLASATALWTSIYAPHDQKLLAKLAQSHPDLPVHILTSHYGPLLADPFVAAPVGHAKLGRILTSVVAIACLRAQGGVGPQVTSHVFGLRKALEPGSGAHEEEDRVDGAEWLTSDEGCAWVIEQVDRIVEVVAAGRSTFATRAKL
ncbi:SPOSA6832_02322, partial [Sporobolomyces salmonicolor]